MEEETNRLKYNYKTYGLAHSIEIPTVTSTAKLLEEPGGNLHGITFDARGGMYYGKNGKEIYYRDNLGGKSALIATIPNAYGFFNTEFLAKQSFVLDLTLSETDGILYAAACERVLRIVPQSRVMETILANTAQGLYGASGVALFSDGTPYIAINDKIAKIADGKAHTLLTIEQMGTSGRFLGIRFDRDRRWLYACNDEANRVYAIPVLSSGELVKNGIVTIDLGIKAEYIAGPGSTNDVIIGGPNTDLFFRMNDAKIIEVIRVDGIKKKTYGLSTFTFGTDDKTTTLYGVTWDSGMIYRIDLS